MSIKESILRIVFPIGSNGSIRLGPMKGMQYLINHNSRWAPIFGRWEPELQSVFCEVIKEGDVVYDLGTNFGLHTMLFSRLVGESGKVYSFEPLVKNIKLINNNLQLNNIQNVTPVNCAVTNYKGSTKFNLGVHDGQGSMQGIGSESGETIEVETTTLDDFIGTGNSMPDVIKIDIEGEESNALIGFKESIGKCKPTIIVELHTPEQDKRVGEFFIEHGYLAYRIIKTNYDSNSPIKYLSRIEDLSSPWPTENGIWGTVVGVHADNPLF
ncbi:MAG TPA: FkbM family methyltransferase [Flavobacteriales bacterium]|nr:FkbM family methyltransferase [Flavobacteriales bacterium]